jgi:hypothetical protein
MSSTAQLNPKNHMTYADLQAVATTLGKSAGEGKDTQIKFLLKMVEGGFHSVIDLETDKHGKDVDDATELAETYVKAQGSAVVFDAKAPNQRKLVSCLRTTIKLGQWPKGGPGEPLATVGMLMTIRQKLRADPANAKKLDDAANTLLRYARTQIKRDQLLDEAELKGMCFKPTAPHKTPEQIVTECRNSLKQLLEGKASAGTAHDTSPFIKAAIGSLNQRLNEIATKRNKAKTVAFTATVTP